MNYAAQIAVYHELHPYAFKIISWLKGPQALGEDYNVEFTRTAIQERKSRFAEEKDKSMKRTPDFLTKFLEARASNPEHFTDYDVFTGCLQNVVAGSDTTSITLTSILYHLLKNPRTLRALRQEVDTMTSAGDISDPPTFQDSQKMNYLQAVLKEALRVHPAVGLPFWRKVPKGGAVLCGQFFPQGTVVGINSWVAHRNPTVFGVDAAEFRPERWLEASKEELSRMERYFIPFGHGSRTCIGKNISILEIGKLIPRLVRLFNFEMADEELRTDNKWFVKQLNFKCRISSRVT